MGTMNLKEELEYNIKQSQIIHSNRYPTVSLFEDLHSLYLLIEGEEDMREDMKEIYYTDMRSLLNNIYKTRKHIKKVSK